MTGIGSIRAGRDVQREAGRDGPDGTQFPTSEEARGKSEIEAKRIAYATVNKLETAHENH